MFVVPLHVFRCASTISRFGQRFRNGQYSLLSFVFYSRCPHAQPFVKVGARAPVTYGVGATDYDASP